MTVIERELVEGVGVTTPHTPFIEAPITEREQRARTLEAAALEIDYRGWMQGNPYQEDISQGVCLLGAVSCAFGRTRYDWHDADVEGIFFSGSDRPYISLWGWNDAPGREVEEVKFVLRWRAEEIRDGR